MKVLHVTTSMDPKSGGPPQGLRNSIPNLVPFGFANEVLTCDAPDCAWLGTDAFPVHAVGPGRTPLRFTPKLGAWLDQNLHRFDGVIIHGLWLWSSICTTRAVARERARRAAREVAEDRELKREGEGGASVSPQNSALIPPKQLRCFVMPHGMLDPWFQRDKSRRVKAVRNWFYWWLVERKVVNSADAVFFTCQEELRLARTTFRGYQPRAEINVTYGVVEPPAPTLAMREAFVSHCPGLDRPYMLFLSRVHPKKGVDLLVRAYAQVVMEKVRSSKTRQPSGQGHQLCDFPDLVIAGPGWNSDYGREVRALVDEANKALMAEAGGLRPEGASTLDLRLKTSASARIHAVGMLSGAAKWGALYGCEAFVLPSHQENFGIAVVEALACGKPVLISNQVNIWREIEEDGAGLVEDDTEEGVEKLLGQFFAGYRRQEPGDGGMVASAAPVFSPAEQSTGDVDPHAGGQAIAATTSPRIQPSALNPQLSSTAPRACYLRRFAIGPATERLAEVLRSAVLGLTGLGGVI